VRLTLFEMAYEISARHHAHVNEVTRLLEAMAGGDTSASDQLIALLYADLRRMAAQRIPANAVDQTLQATELVHEAWLRLGGSEMQGAWQSRSHFFATASTAMRCILVDRARRRNAVRHGGGQERANIDDLQLADGRESDEQVLAVHEALERLAIEDPRKAELVKLRYFGGFSIDEAAAALDISEPTAKRWWAYARAWLGREITF
jgi:RNA polymerase sigma factor (TIGR02999 family)